MFTLSYTHQFKKDLQLAEKRGYNITLIRELIDILEENGKVGPGFLPHKLKGEYIDCMECHINPDWLLIWRVNNKLEEITLVRTGTHSDLF